MGVAVTRRICGLVGLGLLLAACPPAGKGKAPASSSAGTGTSSETKKNDPDRNLALATLAGGKITVGQLEDELNRQNPYIRMRFTSVERKREFLKNMVRFEVLAREARRKGLQNDP